MLKIGKRLAKCYERKISLVLFLTQCKSSDCPGIVLFISTETINVEIKESKYTICCCLFVVMGSNKARMEMQR